MSGRHRPPSPPMAYDPAIHDRRSIRLTGFDYSRRGAYFVTLCTSDRQCLFGEVTNGSMHLNDWGRLVETCWGEIPKHYPHVVGDAFVIMPNHVHGILMFEDERAGHAPPLHPLGTVLGSFKAAVTRAINRVTGVPRASVWQRNYFEHVVRDDESMGNIREYIRTNPERWDRDAVNPDGDGSDDVETWVAAQAMAAKKRAQNQTEQNRSGPVARGQISGTEGGA